jgi:hypothetical protein
MFPDRAPDPIARLGPTRDRPFEATHFDRVEAGRRAAEDRAGRRRGPTPHRQARPTPSSGALPRSLDAAHATSTAGEDERPPVGTHLDVRA